MLGVLAREGLDRASELALSPPLELGHRVRSNNQKLRIMKVFHESSDLGFRSSPFVLR